MKDLLRRAAMEYVDLVTVDRNGREYRESMPRWLAEQAMACIPLDPNVARAHIERIVVDPQAFYRVKQNRQDDALKTAMKMADAIAARLVA